VRSPDIALDTEGDSLHHYPERLALVQVADVAGDVWLVDPLAPGRPLAARRRVADPRVRSVSTPEATTSCI
jgi:ribonuclease D